MELPCFRAPCFEACLTSLFRRSACQSQVFAFFGRPPLRSGGDRPGERPYLRGHGVYGMKGVRFHIKLKTMTARWPTGIRAGAEFAFKARN